MKAIGRKVLSFENEMRTALEQKSKLRVLIADDSAEIGETLRHACKLSPRIEVIGQARDGAAALRALREFKPDVVILDIHMPIISGIEVLETVKMEGLECIVLVFSGVGEAVYREKCLAMGADYFFDKATEFEKFLSTLGTL
jgi:DNA-binding NarL/FixJ family response regulator